MKLFETLKQDLLIARKTGQSSAADALRFLVGEAERAAKSVGRPAKLAGQPLSDPETISLIVRTMGDLDASILQARQLKRDTNALEVQRTLFQGYLPVRLSEAELDSAIQEALRLQPDAKLGAVMRHLQAGYAGGYDGHFARARVQQALGSGSGLDLPRLRVRAGGAGRRRCSCRRPTG